MYYGYARESSCSWEIYTEGLRHEGGMPSVVYMLLSNACEGRREEGKDGERQKQGERKKGRREKVKEREQEDIKKDNVVLG